MELSQGWQEKLDDFNAHHPNHPPITIRWVTHAIWREKLVWVEGVPIQRSIWEPRWQVGAVLNNRPPGMEKVATYIPGSGGQWFIKLFSWQRQDTEEFLDLDDRIFECLEAGDMTKDNFYADVEAEDEALEEQSAEDARELAQTAASYYKSYDNPIVNMNPDTPATGSWRWRNR